MKPDIKPIGVGDLMVVKQMLVRYEPSEVAHIENVLASESRGREHRRLRRTEESFLVEEEHTEESQRDLQSTERFELQQETQKTIKQDTKFGFESEVAGKFGPVNVSATNSFSFAHSKSESNKKAMEYAKEVTEKSVSKITDKVRTERITKVLEEVEEKNFHKFENALGGNITGVYRWVDKYYRVKVVNYGLRLFYEFFAPEPAAFYIFARTSNINTKLLPKEPEPPELTPADITPESYYGYVKQYDAVGVAAPPRQYLKLTRAIARELPSDKPFSFADNELEIPAGYVRIRTYVSRWVLVADEDDWSLTILHPRASIRASSEGEAETSTTAHLNGPFPVGVMGHNLKSVVISVSVTCERTTEAMSEWRLATYQAIMDAYTKKRLAYEEQLAAAQIQGGVQIGGNNPGTNRSIEREELKKACITLWTGYQFTGVAGVSQLIAGEQDEIEPKHFPRIDLDGAAEMRAEIKFLEQSFDWKNMAYEFYPYYWARRNQWLDKQSLSDSDPLFEDFLKAGAARVLVPVHPAATARVLFYQLTGKLWPDGTEIPQLEPPDPAHDIVAPGVIDQTEDELQLYQDYMSELSGADSGDDLDREITISPDDPEAWMVKVPTSLVWLQPDAALPDFEPEPSDG